MDVFIESMMPYPVYTIGYKKKIPNDANDWNDAIWKTIDELHLLSVRRESVPPYPAVSVKLLYDENNIYLFYKVHDFHLKCTQSNFLDPVHYDSCVEFFVQPECSAGYFNFEFNCAGVLNGSYIEDWAITPSSFAKVTKLNTTDRDVIQYYSSVPGLVETERAEATVWYFKFSLPFRLIEKYIGRKISPEYELWKGNFYKCGDKTSHPHWCSWAKLKELNFHDPECFGKLVFAKKNKSQSEK